MIVLDLWRASTRLWYVVLLGLLATGITAQHVVDRPVVYYSTVDVFFLAPTSTINPNSLTTRSGDLTQTAGVVETLVNGTEQRRKLASPDASLIGRGVVDGYSVTLPDYGGQWAPHFRRPVLQVEVAGPTHEDVRATQRELLQRIEDVLAGVQAANGADPVNWITAEPSVQEPAIRAMGGDRTRALAMVTVVGAFVTLGAVAGLDARRHRRAQARGRRRASRQRRKARSLSRRRADTTRRVLTTAT